MPPPIDPRMQMMQAQALRGGRGGPPGGMPMPGVPPGGMPPSPYAGGPQSGLGMPTAGVPTAAGAPGPIPGAAPTGQMTPASANLVRGVPQAQERFSQGQRAGTLADELRASAMEPIRGRMVGRVYVPASIAEGGAKLMQAYVARKKEQEQKAERAGAKETESGLKADWLESLELGAPPVPGAGGARGA